MSTTLTDRYVWAVLRAVPDAQRPDLEPELRALVADAVEARTATGEPAAGAERAALTELGDPELLAARYTDRSLVLLGPTVFLQWKRLLVLLLPIVVSIGTVVALVAASLDGAPATSLVGVAISAALTVAVQTVFWVTLVFALVERFARHELGGQAWTPDDLPEVPAAGRAGLGDAVTDVATALIGAAAIAWQQVAAPFVVDGVGRPLFDPVLWTFWLPWFLVVLGAQAALAVFVVARGRWTWPMALANAVLVLAFAVPALWLLQTGQLFDPVLLAAIEDGELAGSVEPARAIIAISIVAVSAWEILEGALKASRASSPLGRRVRPSA